MRFMVWLLKFPTSLPSGCGRGCREQVGALALPGRSGCNEQGAALQRLLRMSRSRARALRAQLQAPLQPEHPSGHGMVPQHPSPHVAGVQITPARPRPGFCHGMLEFWGVKIILAHPRLGFCHRALEFWGIKIILAHPQPGFCHGALEFWGFCCRGGGRLDVALTTARRAGAAAGAAVLAQRHRRDTARDTPRTRFVTQGWSRSPSRPVVAGI